MSYVNEIWDGPLDGACLWKGESGYYFASIDEFCNFEDQEKFPYIYVLIKLSELQTQILNTEIELFQQWTARKIDTNEYTSLKNVSILKL